MLEKLRLWYRYWKFYFALKENSTVSQLVLKNSYQSGCLQRQFSLADAGFKIFSQHEEDGIIWYIFSLIGHTNKKCLEMCCGTGFESNTANLIVNHFWTGLLFDGDKTNVQVARRFFGSHKNTRIFPPKVIQAWITAENINQLIEKNGFKGEIDLFSLDVDGVDYYLMKNLEIISPRVIVLEFNHLLGFEKSLSIPYDSSFVAEFSADGSDYAGASLPAFVKLLRQKNYRFIGTNRFATNAFFIRNDIVCSALEEIVDLSLCFKHDRAVYGMQERYKRIAHKPWVEV